MKTVIVGSENPVKLATTKEAFEKVFPDETFEYIACTVASGVSDQPFGTTETKRGALNRATGCRQAFPHADFYVGLEGGLEEIEGEFWSSAWMCILDNHGRVGFGRTGTLQLPLSVSARIHQGEELSMAIDICFNKVNSKHKGGAVGALTNDLITRTDFYRDALVYALIPFIKPELYS